MEARVRRLASNLLDPVVKRNFEDRTIGLSNKRMLGQLEKRLNKVHDYVFKERHVR